MNNIELSVLVIIIAASSFFLGFVLGETRGEIRAAEELLDHGKDAPTHG